MFTISRHPARFSLGVSISSRIVGGMVTVYAIDLACSDSGYGITIMLTRFPCRMLLLMLLCCYPVPQLMAEQDILIIDDRGSADTTSTARDAWRFVGDGVMGGVSDGQLTATQAAGRPCLRLQGEVRLDNNGGFIQGALELPEALLAGIDVYSGVLLEVYGNGEDYNVHLRTRDLWLPWQSYRATFTAPAEWQSLRLPFTGFAAYRTGKALDVSRLQRIGIVAIGRAFSADLCIGKVGFYR